MIFTRSPLLLQLPALLNIGKSFRLPGYFHSHCIQLFQNYFYEENVLAAASVDAANAVFFHRRVCSGNPSMRHDAHGFPASCK